MIDTTQIKERASLIDIAAGVTQLQRESSLEFSGPCPKCGGDDRFHVREDWFFCRQCHPKRGDAIEFMQWWQGLSFKDACEALVGGSLPTVGILPPRPVSQVRSKPKRFNAAYWRRRADAAHADLMESPAARAARDYLASRGLEPHTWLAYGLGFDPAVPLPGTKGKQKEPAISMPWLVGGQLAAVRYRFLEMHEYIDADGKERKTKQTSRGNFSGRMFGGQLLPRCAEDLRTLVVCEGEINAMSIWQVAKDTRLDVLSLGSESQRITDVMARAISKYRTVISWLDQTPYVKGAMGLLPEAFGVTSPDGQDANDLLQAGQLGGFLSASRRRAARNNYEREALLWDLWDAGNMLQGVDGGTADIMQRLATQLGKRIQLGNPEPDHWVTV